MKDPSQGLMLLLLTSLSIFALQKEYKEHDDAYTLNKASDKDSIATSLRKVEKCLEYDQKTIKWRRIFLTTNLSMILIFGLIHKKVPSAKELILYFFFIYTVFYIGWQNYVSRTAIGAVKYGQENLKNIRQKLKEKHTFILPDW